MELVSMIQYMFCLLVECSATDGGEASIVTATAATPSIIVQSNVSENLLMDNEIGSRYRYRHVRRDIEPIVQEAIRQPGIEFLDGTLSDGAPCQFNRDCVNGCCLQNSTIRQVDPQEPLIRRCSPLVSRGDPCSIGQLKGGLYDIHCPCTAGDGACISITNGRAQIAGSGNGHVCNK